MAKTLLIYSPQVTPRVAYILDTLIAEHLGLTLRCTHQAEAYHQWSGPRLAYAPPQEHGHPLGAPDDLLIPACELLFEDDLEPPYVRTTDWRGLPTLFPMDGDCMSAPFDLFAAAFYVLTCFEEYLPFEADRHGRFTAAASALHEHGFLERPLVDLWARELQRILTDAFPDLDIQRPAYRFLPTIDIDQAYAYAGKPLWKNAAALLRDVARLDTASFGERLAVMVQAREDPYNTYRRLQHLADRHGTAPCYFIQVGRTHAHDHALPLSHPLQQKVIRFLDEQGYALGIHPSYRCMERPGMLEAEKQQLEQFLGRPVKDVRMHFLRYRLPQTLREMIAAGLTHDYSLGFADAPGWRAGTSIPHRWFDLEANAPTALIRTPFYTMDRSMRNYQGMRPDDTLPMLYQTLYEVKQLGGVFSFIWHNSSANRDAFGWKAWQVVLEEMMREGARPPMPMVGSQ